LNKSKLIEPEASPKQLTFVTIAVSIIGGHCDFTEKDNKSPKNRNSTDFLIVVLFKILFFMFSLIYLFFIFNIFDLMNLQIYS
jgi:hypothetical protein